MLKIDYKFKDESLLRLAMTHSSYANEHHGTHLPVSYTHLLSGGQRVPERLVLLAGERTVDVIRRDLGYAV